MSLTITFDFKKIKFFFNQIKSRPRKQQHIFLKIPNAKRKLFRSALRTTNYELKNKVYQFRKQPLTFLIS